VTGSGGLFHAFRTGTDGGWTAMGSVPGQAGNPGQVVDTSAAIYYGDLHVVAVTSAGGVYYTMRGFNGSWSQFVDVKAAAGNPAIGAVTDAAIATYQGNVHALFRTSAGGVYYAARAAGGEWSAFVDLPAGDPGQVVDVAVAGIGDNLHILVTNDNGRLFHAVRDTNGVWTPLGDVKQVTGDPGPVTRTAATKANGELHIVVSTGNGGLFHAVRHANGTWTPIGNVKQVAGNPGAVRDVAAGAAWGLDGAGIDGQIQIAVAAGNGGLFHAIRYANGAWTSLGNVKQVSGDPGPVTRVGFSG
jgi:hypothetical protein